ncbi:MAG TPA: peptide-methionine (R)-S-oxide reductase MsrB [Alphaproteobacteria bacterium]|nr:peptide-methionine (R)-S-oxide reductase MsrB [Alphaproteobacteria bacterium]
MTDKIRKSDAEWQNQLTPEQFQVCRMHGTEAPFSGKYANTKDAGTYNCACCGQELFDSATKYDSGSGWPSYYQPVAKDKVTEKTDSTHGMVRTEVLCSKCDAHLGHVFPDGPNPTGLRYCINSVALDLKKR